MNKVITLGLNDYIKKLAISKLPNGKPERILDLCTGTGDMAILLAQKYPDSKIVAVDFSEKMIEVAKEKAKEYSNIEFLKADALELPFEDASVDLVVISFGLRNLSNFYSGLLEMRRVIKQGGIITNIDLGKPNAFVNLFFRPYFFKIVPAMGHLFHGNSKPYQYLPESNNDFPSPNELIGLLKRNNIRQVKNYNYMFGTIAQQIARV